jgi:hypothetical protein
MEVLLVVWLDVVVPISVLVRSRSSRDGPFYAASGAR